MTKLCLQGGGVTIDGLADIVAEEAALQPLNRLGQADEVAALVNFLVSPEASFITGSLQRIDGGYTAQ